MPKVYNIKKVLVKTDAFKDNTTIQSIDLNSTSFTNRSVENSFKGCTALTKVSEFPSDVKISTEAFSDREGDLDVFMRYKEHKVYCSSFCAFDRAGYDSIRSKDGVALLPQEHELKKSYQELESVVADGNQWFDLGLKPTGDNNEVEVIFDATDVYTRSVFGTQNLYPLFVAYNGSIYVCGDENDQTGRIHTGVYKAGYNRLKIQAKDNMVTYDCNGTTETYEVGKSDFGNIFRSNMILLNYFYVNSVNIARGLLELSINFNGKKMEFW